MARMLRELTRAVPPYADIPMQEPGPRNYVVIHRTHVRILSVPDPVPSAELNPSVTVSYAQCALGIDMKPTHRFCLAEEGNFAAFSRGAPEWTASEVARVRLAMYLYGEIVCG